MASIYQTSSPLFSLHRYASKLLRSDEVLIPFGFQMVLARISDFLSYNVTIPLAPPVWIIPWTVHALVGLTVTAHYHGNA